MLFNKVTIKGAEQAVQMFGLAQAAVARRWSTPGPEAANGSRATRSTTTALMVSAVIHWDAADDQKIYDYN